MNPMLLILCWACLGLACSKIARRKNRNSSIWFFLGLSFGIIALIIVYFLKPIKIIAKKNQNPLSQTSLSPVFKDNNYWYYLDNERKQIGPMSLKRLFDNYLMGKISDTTFVWNDTMETWKKLKEVSAFLKILKQQLTN